VNAKNLSNSSDYCNAVSESHIAYGSEKTTLTGQSDGDRILMICTAILKTVP